MVFWPKHLFLKRCNVSMISRPCGSKKPFTPAWQAGVNGFLLPHGPLIVLHWFHEFFHNFGSTGPICKIFTFLSADSFSSALQVIPREKEEEKEKDYFQKKKEDRFLTVPWAQPGGASLGGPALINKTLFQQFIFNLYSIHIHWLKYGS